MNDFMRAGDVDPRRSGSRPRADEVGEQEGWAAGSAVRTQPTGAVGGRHHPGNPLIQCIERHGVEHLFVEQHRDALRRTLARSESNRANVRS